MVPPLMTKPPESCLPEIEDDSTFYPEVWIQYPLSEALRPMHFGPLFKAKMEFIQVVSNFSSSIFGEKGLNTTKITSDSLKGHINRLREWFQKLPEPLRADRIVYPPHLKVQ